MAKVIEIGSKYARLTVLKEHEVRVHGKKAYLCRCDCGNELVVLIYSLLSGNTNSCGCYQKERASQGRKTHGLSRSPEYGVWQNVKSRCYDITASDYHNYGGRGITVCDRWVNSFENFYCDMGKRPSKNHSIERDNVNGNYEPSNCRWATLYEQCRNRRNNHFVFYKGVRYTADQIEEKYGLYPGAVYYYSTIGKDGSWVIEQAKKGLIGKIGRMIEYNGEKKTLRGWADFFGINRSTFYKRFTDTKSIELSSRPVKKYNYD